MMPIDNRYGVFIGVNNYIDNHIPPLQFAATDAKDMAELFSSQGSFKIPDRNQWKLYDETATRENIIETISGVAGTAQENDLVLFYFAGHGCSYSTGDNDEGDNLHNKYIVPYDVDINKINSSAIDFQFLSMQLNRIKSKNLIMIFDCCHSGAMGGRTFPTKGLRGIDGGAIDVDPKYLDEISGSGRFVWTACSGRQVALERAEYGHGVFTHHILEGLRGKADLHGNKHIGHLELLSYVMNEMRRKHGQEQTPVMAGRLEGASIYLGLSPSTQATEDNKEEIERRIVWNYPNIRVVKLSDDDSTISIATEASKYLSSLLTHRMKISVSCGRTLIETISMLERKNLSGIEIFPLNGSPTDEVRITDSMVLTYMLWSKFEPGEARAHVVPTGIPHDLFAKIEEGVETIAAGILEKAIKSNIFLFGIGNPRNNHNIWFLLEKAGLTFDDLDELGAAGEINFHLYDESGMLLALSDRLSEEDREKIERYNSKFFSISAKDIAAIKDDSRIESIAVAGGVDKREAIKAALTGGLVTTLVTDLETGAWLAEL